MGNKKSWLNRFKRSVRGFDYSSQVAQAARQAARRGRAGDLSNWLEHLEPRVLLSASVFINELHYDNTGGDTGEAVEIAGPAGTNLSGWSVALYNGAAGQFNVYDTINLSGTIPNQQNGFGTLSFLRAGIQNGSPDGLALVNNASAVVQFLSYEGTFTAASGPAAGMTSTDIGVIEPGSDPIGLSLQLTGGGSVAEHFTWMAPATATFSAVNNGQTFVGGPAAPQLVISEIMYNPASSEPAWEWIELYNAGSTSVDLSGYVLDDNNSVAHTAANIASGTINPGQTAVLYNVDLATAANFEAAWGTGINLVAVTNWSALALNNTGDRVGLWDSFADYSGDHVNHANTLVDVTYDDVSPWPTGTGSASIYLTDLNADAHVGANWALSTVGAVTPTGTAVQSNAAGGNSGGDIGSPGGAPPLPVVVINEIMQNPNAVADAAGEWFELFNPTTFAIDLNGWTIKDNGTDSHNINNGGPLILAPSGFLVLGNNANSATNGGVTVAYQYSGFTLANADDEVVLLDTALNEIDRVEYDGGPLFPNPTGASMALNDPNLDNNIGADWSTSTAPFGVGDLGTPGAENSPGGGGGATPKFIHEIQGTGLTSPLLGQAVVIQGIVVGDFQDTVTQLSGFYVQEEDAQADADPATSEGIFVFDNGFGVDVHLGDLVSVTGNVFEFSSSGITLTELNSITAISILAAAQPLPTSAQVILPVASLNDWERYEGMRVHFSQELTVTETFDLGRFGEVSLSQGGRLFNPTNVTTPGAAANALADLNNRRRIVLDDGNSQQNRDPILFPQPGGLTALNTLRSGDTVPSLTGVLDQRFGDYRVEPTEAVQFTPSNPRTTTPDNVGGTLKVASFNVLNFFNGDGTGGGFPTSRGADSLSEFNRQRDKILSAILAMDADVIGLIEIENDGYGPNSAIADLVNGLNTGAPLGTTYSYINPDLSQLGGDEIAVGFVFRYETVAPVGAAATINTGAFSALNRQPLAQTFMEISSGEVFTPVINHFKSKGGTGTGADADQGDGQGNFNATRTQAALDLIAWIQTDPTASNDPDFLVIGDLNAYAMEDPITTFQNAGYTNLVNTFVGTNAYSYVFFGESGYLDHALANPDMTAQVTGVTEWHINADEPTVLDYNEEFKSSNQLLTLYNADPYRASDHDPVIIGLQLSPPAQPLTVSSTSVNNGAAQRSNVESLTVAFNHDVVFNDLLAAVQVVRVGGSAVGLSLSAFNYNLSTFTLTIDLTTDGLGGSQSTLLTDGLYELRLDTTRISIAGQPASQLVDNDGSPDGTFTFGFHRLEGDFNGNRSVDVEDRSLLFDAYGARIGDPGYEFALDLDRDGVISSRDYSIWRRLFGHTV